MTLTRDRKAEMLSGARLFDGVDAEGMDRILRGLAGRLRDLPEADRR